MEDKYITIPYSPIYDHLCLSFSCGNVHIDNFIRNLDNQNPDIGTTYLWVNDLGKLLGFYNITTGHIDMLDEYGNRVKMGGSIHINIFAIANNYRGKIIYGNTKYSEVLLDDCLNRIESIRDNVVGFSFITLNSTKEGKSLYLNNGFDEIEADMDFSGNKDEYLCYSMYLALGLEYPLI